MRTTTTLTFGKGINFDAPPFELGPGFWTAGTVNYRSRGGVDESWDGAQLQYSSGSVVPLWGMPFATSTKYGVYCSSTKLYSLSGASSLTEITRKTDGIVITNMTRSGTTVTVTTASAHGLTAASSVVDVYGTVPSTYNRDGVTVASTPTATTFTYVASTTPATSPATVMGAYAVSGTSNFSALSGFQRYTGGAWNGLFLFNHPGAGLYYWNGDTSIKARKVPGFNGTSTWNTAVSVRPWKNFIVIIGKTENGTTYRQNVTVSDVVTDPSTLPTSYAATSTNQALSTELTETNGAGVDCLPMGDQNIIYFTDARYAHQYTESSPYHRFTRLPGNSGLAFPGCVVSTPVGHVFLTPDFDVMVHQGGEAKSVAAGRVRKFLTDNVYMTSAHVSFLCVHPNKNEVWVCFPSLASAAATIPVCDKALAWNWVDDTWGYFDLTSGGTATSGVSFGANGTWPSGDSYRTNKDVLGLFANHTTDTTKTGLYVTLDEDVSTSGKFFDAEIGATLVRQGIDLGDRNVMKTLHRSRWVIDGATGDGFTVYHGSSMYADTAPTYVGAISFYQLGTSDYANARATQGRFLALKLVFTGGQISTTVRVRSVDIDVATGGTR